VSKIERLAGATAAMALRQFSRITLLTEPASIEVSVDQTRSTDGAEIAAEDP